MLQMLFRHATKILYTQAVCSDDSGFSAAHVAFVLQVFFAVP